MRIALIILLVIQIISNAVLGITALAQNFWVGIILLAVAVLSVAPIIALLHCLEETEDLRRQCSWLGEKLRALERAMGVDQRPVMTEERIPQPVPALAAEARWLCPKCQSVNPEGTSFCAECGAHYSLEFGGVEDRPLTKWKLKEYKKKK